MRTQGRLRSALVVLAVVALSGLQAAHAKLGDTRGFVPMAPVALRRQASMPTRPQLVPRSRNSLTRHNHPKWLGMVRQLGADAVAAAAAALSVSPIIAILDRSIILSASRGGSMTAALVSGLKEMSRPLTFLRYKEVWWVWALYAGTYVAANGISTVAESLGVGAGAPKLVGTTAVNLPASIIKDQALARMFSATAATTAAAAAVSRMPLASYALFTLRDIVSIAASFTLPEAVASHLTEARDWSTAAAEGTSQLLVPSAMQLITTPLHLVGLDIFNRPAASTAMRMQMLGRLYGSSLALRFGRTGIAFGLGGVVNKKVRDALRKPPQRISLPLPAAA